MYGNLKKHRLCMVGTAIRKLLANSFRFGRNKQMLILYLHVCILKYMVENLINC